VATDGEYPLLYKVSGRETSVMGGQSNNKLFCRKQIVTKAVKMLHPRGREVAVEIVKLTMLWNLGGVATMRFFLIKVDLK
jgi:hypothetical protein